MANNRWSKSRLDNLVEILGGYEGRYLLDKVSGITILEEINHDLPDPLKIRIEGTINPYLMGTLFHGPNRLQKYFGSPITNGTLTSHAPDIRTSCKERFIELAKSLTSKNVSIADMHRWLGSITPLGIPKYIPPVRHTTISHRKALNPKVIV